MSEPSFFPWNLVVGFLATIASGLVLFYLRDIKQSLLALSGRIDKQDAEINHSINQVAELSQKMSICKVDCERQFVTAENFIRSESYTRKKLDGIAESFAALQGEIKVAARLPEMAGAVAREILNHMNNKETRDARP